MKYPSLYITVQHHALLITVQLQGMDVLLYIHVLGYYHFHVLPYLKQVSYSQHPKLPYLFSQKQHSSLLLTHILPSSPHLIQLEPYQKSQILPGVILLPTSSHNRTPSSTFSCSFRPISSNSSAYDDPYSCPT